jgi:mono/diheme cytochrome c family protein
MMLLMKYTHRSFTRTRRKRLNTARFKLKNVYRVVAAATFTMLGTTAQAQSDLSVIDSQITYADHVAQIITDNCVVCHREGGIGPMQLTSYEQVRPWAPLVSLRVANKEMPPYSYDDHIGIQDLQGDWRLSDEEINTITQWVAQGAFEGDWGDRNHPVADLPAADEWTFADQLGQPTLVLDSSPIDVPAIGNDMWHRPYVQTGLTADRCIKAMQVKPAGNAKAVVHHANSNVEIMNADGEYEDYGMFTEYAMGKWGEIVPEGVCRTLPANARIRWDIHMFPGGVGATAPGTVIEDNVVEIGVWLHPEGYTAAYEQDLKLYRLNHGELIVPPHGTAMTQGFHSFDHPVRIDSFQPHGHLRLRAASLEIYYPTTGRTEPISQISNWSATWHHSHLYEEDVAPLVPTGAVLVIKQWYDNTANNPNNPDPDFWVVDGSRTADEMSHAWIAVTHLDDAGFAQLTEERNETSSVASN